jgi:hypothetical protein
MSKMAAATVALDLVDSISRGNNTQQAVVELAANEFGKSAIAEIPRFLRTQIDEVFVRAEKEAKAQEQVKAQEVELRRLAEEDVRAAAEKMINGQNPKEQLERIHHIATLLKDDLLEHQLRTQIAEELRKARDPERAPVELAAAKPVREASTAIDFVKERDELKKASLVEEAA